MSKPSRDWVTLREIASQPAVWSDLSVRLPTWSQEIRSWIDARKPDEIWLSGAGTSAFVGEALAEAPSLGRGRPVRAVASTDLVGSPQSYLRRRIRPLVVSFGRSGNSPESVGVLDLLDRFAPDADRLSITCNAEGALAQRTWPGPGQGRTLVLPEATHDQGFAMTASFTCMLYVALACLSDASQAEIGTRMAQASAVAGLILSSPLSDLGLAPRPERVVFLGAGPLRAAARESALKVLELTAGAIPTLWDTPLGFRHGPKSFVTPGTRIVVLRSRQAIAAAYDADLVEELRDQFGPDSVVSLGSDRPPFDRLGDNDDWNVPLLVLPAQRAGVAWAEELGLNVDDPFEGRGTLTRVVSGVRLHTEVDWQPPAETLGLSG
jgi:fructoselysine-6-P-deglycase FrlB-like protein